MSTIHGADLIWHEINDEWESEKIYKLIHGLSDQSDGNHTDNERKSFLFHIRNVE